MTPEQLTSLMKWIALCASHKNQHADKIAVYAAFGFYEAADGSAFKSASKADAESKDDIVCTMDLTGTERSHIRNALAEYFGDTDCIRELMAKLRGRG